MSGNPPQFIEISPHDRHCHCCCHDLGVLIVEIIIQPTPLVWFVILVMPLNQTYNTVRNSSQIAFMISVAISNQVPGRASSPRTALPRARSRSAHRELTRDARSRPALATPTFEHSLPPAQCRPASRTSQRPRRRPKSQKTNVLMQWLQQRPPARAPSA